MRTFLTISLFVLTTAFACSSNKKTTKADAKQFYNVADTSVVMTISKTYCFGKCPVYDMKIMANGNVSLKAIDHLHIENGDYTSTISQATIELLYNTALEINYFSLDSIYTNEYIQDVPTTYTLLMNKDTKEIKRIENKWEAPAELKTFEEKLHALVTQLQWKAI
ncbi:MAG: DUF6438 domain-containing protein [Bacteroidia bacterium]